MTGRRRRGHGNRSGRYTPSSRILERAQLLDAKLRGCTCEPELERRHTAYGWHAITRHDNDCPAARVGRSVVIIPEPEHRPDEGRNPA